MPEKDPNLWVWIITLIREAWHDFTSSKVWLGFALAVMMVMLRNLYDDNPKSLKVKIAEALICGGLTLAISTILDYLGLPNSASICVGGVIGFIGIDQIRDVIKKLINKFFKGNYSERNSDDS